MLDAVAVKNKIKTKTNPSLCSESKASKKASSF